jgi:hypothetical protein
MQAQDNVVLFPNLTVLELHNNSVRVRGVQQHLTNRIEKGVTAMSRQSVVRVTKTMGGNKNTRPHRNNGQHVASTAQPSGRNERFVELARKRVPRALHVLQLVENLASHNYKYTPEQADKIIRTLEDAVARVRDAFMKPKRVEQKYEFNL